MGANTQTKLTVTELKALADVIISKIQDKIREEREAIKEKVNTDESLRKFKQQIEKAVSEFSYAYSLEYPKKSLIQGAENQMGEDLCQRSALLRKYGIGYIKSLEYTTSLSQLRQNILTELTVMNLTQDLTKEETINSLVTKYLN